MGLGFGVDGDDERIWKVAAAARADADAAEVGQTDAGGIWVPLCIGLIGEIILEDVRDSCPLPSGPDGVLG